MSAGAATLTRHSLLPYRGNMSEELSKRIDDLRADMNQRFNDVNLRLNDMNQKLTTFMWIVSGWFTFLTAVLAVFGFLRR